MEAEIIDELMGCRCDEAVHCVETVFRHDDNGDGLLVTTFACDGCNKRVKVVSRIKAILDVHERTSLRTSPSTFNEWSNEWSNDEEGR